MAVHELKAFLTGRGNMAQQGKAGLVIRKAELQIIVLPLTDYM